MSSQVCQQTPGCKESMPCTLQSAGGRGPDKLAQTILCHAHCSQFKSTTSGLPREKEGLNKMLLAPLHCPDTEQAKPKLQQPQTSRTGACCTSPGAKHLPPKPPVLRRDTFLKPFRKRPLSLPFLRVLKNHYQQGEKKKNPPFIL